MARDEVLERLDQSLAIGNNWACVVGSDILRAAAEIIRESDWRPIAEAPSDRTLILVGRWHRGAWQWKETWFAGQAAEDGYTHYLPEPAPPAREVSK